MTSNKSRILRARIMLSAGAVIGFGAAWCEAASSQMWSTSSGYPGVFLPGILKVAAQSTFFDVDSQTAGGAAIASMIEQGVMLGRTPTEFAPSAPTTRGELSLALQQLFALRTPAEPRPTPDIPLGTPVSSAAQAVAPFLNEHLLCPGCALGTNFRPNQETSRGQVIVALISILVAQHKLTLLSPSESDSVLARVVDASGLSQPARVYFATAIRDGILELMPGNRIDPSSAVTRADLALHLDRVQKQYDIPHAVKTPG